MIIQPIGAPSGKKDISCCWFALGSLWKLLEGYSDDEMVTITAPQFMDDFGPRGGHGDMSAAGVTTVTVPQAPLSPQSIPEGEWDIDGLTLTRGDESVEISEGSMVKFVAFTGMSHDDNDTFNITQGSYCAGDYREALLRERQWWMTTLGIKDEVES